MDGYDTVTNLANPMQFPHAAGVAHKASNYATCNWRPPTMGSAISAPSRSLLVADAGGFNASNRLSGGIYIRRGPDGAKAANVATDSNKSGVVPLLGRHGSPSCVLTGYGHTTPPVMNYVQMVMADGHAKAMAYREAQGLDWTEEGDTPWTAFRNK